MIRDTLEGAQRQRPLSRAFRILLALLAVAAPGWAVPTIDFFVTPNTGVVAFAGGPTPMIGADIGIGFVVGNNTPGLLINGLPYACIDCALNFATGPLIGTSPNAWLFDAGPTSFITISGSVDINSDGVGDIGPSFGNLLTGTFVGQTLTVDALPGAVPALAVTAAAFFDFKNPLLAAFYGLPATPFSGTLRITWFGIGDPPGLFSGQPIAINGSPSFVRNEFIPEPATLAVFGIGLVGLLRSRCRSRV